MQERLQKLIAQAGVASRRAAEKLIAEGAVTVNGQIITEPGTKADPEKDHIKVNGKLINLKIAAREKVYILLNKPKGYLSSAADPEGRKLVVDLVPKSFGKVHPVGRLDYNTEGLLILTNDGDFTNLVASSKKIPKVYEVKVKGLPPKVALNKLRRGTLLDDGFKTAPAEITELRATENNGWFEVTLHEGHNQQIRKMFDAIGHSVVKLRRIRIGNLADETLPVGAYHVLTPGDVASVTKPPIVKVASKTAKPATRSAARPTPARSRDRDPDTTSRTKTARTAGTDDFRRDDKPKTGSRDFTGPRTASKDEKPASFRNSRRSEKDGERGADRRSSVKPLSRTARPASDKPAGKRFERDDFRSDERRSSPKPPSRSAKPASDRPTGGTKSGPRRSRKP